jgi:hypothetical protein
MFKKIVTIFKHLFTTRYCIVKTFGGRYHVKFKVWWWFWWIQLTSWPFNDIETAEEFILFEKTMNSYKQSVVKYIN